jgi:preprotein translocase subunit YajC
VELAIAWLLLMVAAFWFLIVRPQRRRMVELQQLQRALAVGDEVVTTAGIYGTIRGLDDRTVELEIAPGTRIRLARGAIGQRVGPPPTGDDAPPPIT